MPVGRSGFVTCFALITALGCGRIDFESVSKAVDASPASDAYTGTRDARIVDAHEADARTDANVLGSFEPPTLMTEVSTPTTHEGQPELSANGLELFFVRAPMNYASHGIWRTQRTTVDSPWQPPEEVTELNAGSINTHEPTLSANGLTIWLTSLREGAWDIFTSTRSARDAPWSAPTRVSEVSSAGNDYVADVFDEDRVMLLSSNQPQDLFVATRTDAASAWQTPVAITELNTASVERKAFVPDDGLVIYFGTDRRVAGPTDIFVATRSDTTQSFGEATLVDELASDAYDDDPCVSADLRRILFASDRGGTWDIYEATR